MISKLPDSAQSCNAVFPGKKKKIIITQIIAKLEGNHIAKEGKILSTQKTRELRATSRIQ